MNLSEMIGIVRMDLHDQDSANYGWSDNELKRHIARAVREFSRAIPLDATEVVATDAGKLSINITDIEVWTEINAVEYPIGLAPACYRRFFVWEDIISLADDKLVPDGNNCRVYFTVPHILDADGSTIPIQFEDLVAEGACGFAAKARGRHGLGGGNSESAEASVEMLAWGQERLAGFRSDLRQLGSTNAAGVNRPRLPRYQPISIASDLFPVTA